MTLRVVEGISGVWFYHLREEEDGKRNLLQPALCGAPVMVTQIPISCWNRTPKDYHIPEHWCSTCEKLSGLRKEADGTFLLPGKSEASTP